MRSGSPDTVSDIIHCAQPSRQKTRDVNRRGIRRHPRLFAGTCRLFEPLSDAISQAEPFVQ